MATGTAPRDWWDEDPDVIATALHAHNDQQRRAKKEAKK